MLIDSGRQTETDKKFDANASDVAFASRLFVRLVAKDKSFTRVDFKYSIFDSCYLRGCKFDSCDFTGCRFVGTNLHGSKFAGCKFEYATFEKTLVDANILDTECPGHENLKSRFARTLRMNFQQLGDAAAVNKAMRVEMDATAIHLHKAAWSNEAYYRSHYAGWWRITAVAEWLEFGALDFVWGNGESLFRLIRFVLVVLGFITIGDVATAGDPGRVASYVSSFIRSFEIFFGTLTPDGYGKGYLAFITCLRLVVVAFFISIIFKKFNRR